MFRVYHNYIVWEIFQSLNTSAVFIRQGCRSEMINLDDVILWRHAVSVSVLKMLLRWSVEVDGHKDATYINRSQKLFS